MHVALVDDRDHQPTREEVDVFRPPLDARIVKRAAVRAHKAGNEERVKKKARPSRVDLRFVA